MLVPEEPPEEVIMSVTVVSPYHMLFNFKVFLPDSHVPELEEVLEVVPEDWDCSKAGLVDTLLLVLVPSSAVFLKKLCCRA